MTQYFCICDEAGDDEDENEDIEYNCGPTYDLREEMTITYELPAHEVPRPVALPGDTDNCNMSITADVTGDTVATRSFTYCPMLISLPNLPNRDDIEDMPVGHSVRPPEPQPEPEPVYRCLASSCDESRSDNTFICIFVATTLLVEELCSIAGRYNVAGISALNLLLSTASEVARISQRIPATTLNSMISLMIEIVICACKDNLAFNALVKIYGQKYITSRIDTLEIHKLVMSLALQEFKRVKNLDGVCSHPDAEIWQRAYQFVSLSADLAPDGDPLHEDEGEDDLSEPIHFSDRR